MLRTLSLPLDRLRSASVAGPLAPRLRRSTYLPYVPGVRVWPAQSPHLRGGSDHGHKPFEGIRRPARGSRWASAIIEVSPG